MNGRRETKKAARGGLDPGSRDPSAKLSCSSDGGALEDFEESGGWSSEQNQVVGKCSGGRSKGKFGLGAHFVFKRMLGEGSEGQTWECEDVITKQDVAVKVIPRHADDRKGAGAGSSLKALRMRLVSKKNAPPAAPRPQSKSRKQKSKARRFNPSRVAAEIIMQCSLSHPNLVQLTAVYMSSTHLGLVLELVKGGEVSPTKKKDRE